MSFKRDTINILGIEISLLKKKDTQKQIVNFLASPIPHYLVTPNPEILMLSEHDEEFFNILSKADLAVPDGVGLSFAALAMGKNLHRYPGAELIKFCLDLASNRKEKVAVINLVSGLSSAEEINKALKNIWPGLDLLVIDTAKDRFPKESIDSFKPSIVFVALGAPAQEKYIYKYLLKLPYLRLAVGIGGALNFLTGKSKRAPKIFRVLGMEWLWRPFVQKKGRKFWRLKKVLAASFVFPVKFIKWRFWNPFFYRPNVACFLFREKQGETEILLLERANHNGHWQLPQGGTDGESLGRAGERELSEEIGTDKFFRVATFKNVLRYRFSQYDEFKDLKGRRKWGYKGQKQGLFIAHYTGHDEDIKLNYWDYQNHLWTKIEEASVKIHPIRQKNFNKFIKLFKTISL